MRKPPPPGFWAPSGQYPGRVAFCGGPANGHHPPRGAPPDPPSRDSISLGGLTQPTTHLPTPSPEWKRYNLSKPETNLPAIQAANRNQGGGSRKRPIRQDVHPRPADPPVMPPFSAIWPPRLRRRRYSIEQFPLLPCPERYINNRQPRDRNSHQTSCQTSNDRHRQQSSQNKHESHPPPLRLCFAVGNLLLPFYIHRVFGQLPFHLHFVVVSLHMLVDQLRRCAGMKIIVRTESLRGRKRASPLGLGYPCCPRLSRECLCELHGEAVCRYRRVVLFR